MTGEETERWSSCPWWWRQWVAWPELESVFWALSHLIPCLLPAVKMTYSHLSWAGSNSYPRWWWSWAHLDCCFSSMIGVLSSQRWMGEVIPWTPRTPVQTGISDLGSGKDGRTHSTWGLPVVQAKVSSLELFALFPCKLFTRCWRARTRKWRYLCPGHVWTSCFQTHIWHGSIGISDDNPKYRI